MKSPKLLLAIVVAAAIGCGVKEEVKTVTPAGPPPAKAMLEEVAKTGELGSGAMEIRSSLETVKGADAAKGEALLKDMDELEKLGDPEQIKAKAAEMAGKL